MGIRRSYKAIILFGIVSLLGDVIYEGARSITPRYFGYLGVSAFIVGVIFSLGEFISISFRIFSGVLADITRRYWLLYILGYSLIIAIPLIGFIDIWWIVAILVIIERLAKAIRSPPRDTLLSIVSSEVGAGKAFGLHELLDQVGAVAGPLILGIILLYTGGDYTLAYSTLFIPYIILLLSIIYTYSVLKGYVRESIPEPHDRGVVTIFKELGPAFKLYCIAVTVNTMGLIHWSLILYQTKFYVAAYVTTFLYLAIQLVDALAAPIAGYLYDRYGRGVLAVAFILSIVPTVLTLHGGWSNLVLAGIIFGVIYGMQESIYRATVVDMSPTKYRGSAYGIFNTFYGLGFLFSGSIYGYLISNNLLVEGTIYAVTVEVIALAILFKSLTYVSYREANR